MMSISINPHPASNIKSLTEYILLKMKNTNEKILDELFKLFF